ncbi:MAG TPA: molybdopterin-dependent oxidoreductase [Methylophilaceae bacterium]|jgi:assimilatory nitrate reductase catalytic subunit
MSRPAHPQALPQEDGGLRETRATCCYCGVGCGVIIRSTQDRIVGVRGDPDHPANFGRLCTKGSTLHLTTGLETRLLHPELRTERATTRLRTSWDEALDHAAARFADIITKHGPDAVAFYISGQLLTEDYYVFNKLAKGLIGTNNIDTNSRLCMSSAIAGYKTTLGTDAPPACYEDIDHARVLFIAGSNTAYAHPIVFRRIENARSANPELKIVVVDPRRTDTAQAADLHLAIQPGTDVVLFNGMLNVMLWEGLADMDYIRAHTGGFEALRKCVREYTPRMAAEICGIREEDLVTAARWFAQGPTLSLYCQGLNQSVCGTDKNAALINLHLATGQIGRSGAGPFSLTGQPNAMGGREVGGMANLLPAHRDLTNPGHRAEIARFWGVESIPATPGKTAVEMFDALLDGSIRAIWIACTNPAQSMPDLNRVRAALERAELVVLQEAYRHTDTAAFADVLLPAASWGEKEGTVTNSERRITHARAAVSPPGEARADWEIATDFARRLGERLDRKREAVRLFPYTHPEQIFNEHREMTRGYDLDITGLSYRLLDIQGPQQWPFPEGAQCGRARLYTDGRFATPDGKARFHIAHYQGTADRTDARLPLHLNTGRLRDQWHGMSRTGTVPQLFNHTEEPLISMHPDDMQRHAILPGDLVQVSNRRGSLVLRAVSADDMLPGQVFIPMHWGSRFMQGLGVNALMPGDFDPVSKQPELKHAAVRVEKANLPWRLTVLRQGGTDLLESLRPLLTRFEYASCGLFGREPGMVILRAAHTATPDSLLIEELRALLGMHDGQPMLHYDDAKRGICKRILVEGDLVTGVLLVGESLAADWLKQVMTDGGLTPELRRWALAPVSAPPAGHRSRGRTVCNCLDIAENEILEAIAAGADLSALQAGLRCGTQCGSCVPELRKLVQLHRRHAA